MGLHYRTPPSHWLGEEIEGDVARYLIDSRALELALEAQKRASGGGQMYRTQSGRLVRKVY